MGGESKTGRGNKVHAPLITNVSLKPIKFGEYIILPLKHGYLIMTELILAGLEVIDTDIVFMYEYKKIIWL